jgi:hypothetical protein
MASRQESADPSKAKIRMEKPTGPGLVLTFESSVVNCKRICFVPVPEWIGMYTCDSQQEFKPADAKMIGNGRRAFWFKKEIMEQLKGCRPYSEKDKREVEEEGGRGRGLSPKANRLK